MFFVIPSLYSYSVEWEACSSSSPGWATVIFLWDLPTLFIVPHVWSRYEVVACGCGIILEQIFDSLCFQLWDFILPLGLT